MLNISEKIQQQQYHGMQRAMFTLHLENDTPVFVNFRIVNVFIDILRVARRKCSTINWAYVFMPSQVHIILESVTEQSNLEKTIDLFKQQSELWFTEHIPNVHWEKNFCNHILNLNDELSKQILDMANNPVRQSLVKHWTEYPFTGSLDYDLDTIV
jgi:hypothetical protein